MMTGHALLAFILAAAAAIVSGYDRDHTLQLACVAAVFAMLPDVDILYAWKAILQLVTAGLSTFVDAFWSASAVSHRGISHSIVTGLVAGTGFSLYMYDGRRRTAVLVFSLLTAGTLLLAGILPALIMGVYAVLGLYGSKLVRQYTSLSPKAFGSAVIFGLVSHPFGDIFTGTPPNMFYPFNLSLIPERVLLHPDPTFNLLTLFLLELVLIWGALATYTLLRTTSLPSAIHPLAAVGLLYSIAPFIIPDPTLRTSYQFVFSIVGTGLLTASTVPLLHSNTTISRSTLSVPSDAATLKQAEPLLLSMLATGAAAMTIAFFGYLLTYALL